MDCEGTRYEEPPGKSKSSCGIKLQCLVEKAAFFDYFLCRRKESDPPAGEAATAYQSRHEANSTSLHKPAVTQHDLIADLTSEPHHKRI
jgi:hypothetical protein